MLRAGQLDVIAGCMFAGKTRELIARVRAFKKEGRKVHVLKPEIDVRYSQSEIVSHDGARLEATTVALDGSPWPENADVIALDEAQFLTLDVMPRVRDSVRRGAYVLMAGLDLTSRGEPFGPMPALLALADHVTKLRAKCAVCGKEGASRSFRVVEDGRTVLVGGAEAYEPRCLSCFHGASDV